MPGLRRDRRRALQGARAAPSSARRTPTSSRWARRPRTRPTARRTTRGTRRASRAARAAARAAAVAGGLAPWALGSDTGGSIKQPSALCGNVGLRPTYGTVSRYGVVAFASSLDQVGPVDAAPCATARSSTRIIAGRDENDSTTVDVPPVELPSGERPEGRPDRRPAGAERRRGDRAGRRARRSTRRSSSRESARRRGRGVLAAALGRLRPRLLLPDRARPRPRRTSRATTASATGSAPTATTSARW